MMYLQTESMLGKVHIDRVTDVQTFDIVPKNVAINIERVHFSLENVIHINYTL